MDPTDLLKGAGAVTGVGVLAWVVYYLLTAFIPRMQTQSDSRDRVFAEQLTLLRQTFEEQARAQREATVEMMKDLHEKWHERDERLIASLSRHGVFKNPPSGFPGGPEPK